MGTSLPERSAPYSAAEVVVDRSGVIVRWPDHGLPAPFVTNLGRGGDFLSAIHPNDRPFIAHTLEWLAGEAGRRGRFQFRFQGRPGQWPIFVATGRHSDELVSLILNYDDLSAALRAEAQMRRVVEGSRQGIIVMSDRQVLYINDGYAQLLGYANVRELNAANPVMNMDFVHPDDRAMILERTRSRAAGLETISNYEIRMRRCDGQEIWAAISATAVNWDGKRASLAWMIDVTARKQAEAALIKSKEAAEFANRSKTDFLANMSHELRTPLNAVIGFAEIIRDQIFGAVGHTKYQEYAGDIHRSGRHLLDLINDILDLSKLEAGKLELRESEFPVGDILEDCAGLIRSKAKETGIRLDVEPCRAHLRADARAVKQILLNFLSNAVKFTPSGGTIRIWSAFVENSGFEISVSDTGIGMSESEIEVALAPFGQIDSMLARRHVGTGLGLPLSRSLLRLHGGDVRITSSPGRGTTMIAHFPIERVLRY